MNGVAGRLHGPREEGSILSAAPEPVAIVGIGCRFPGGADSKTTLWNMLCNGRDAIVDVPEDRWDTRRYCNMTSEARTDQLDSNATEGSDSSNVTRRGMSAVASGGFLQSRIDEFDPLFFGISPREAESLDPQQRLLLEVAWECIDDAGENVERLAGDMTGVFVGGFCLDNMILQLAPTNRHRINADTSTSSTMALLANRLSYVFDFRGPSITVDTACSSSLVATHLACQSLWAGECSVAFCGGVNVMFNPAYPIAMSQGQFLSPHGRCMTFDERATGYARGEGCGIVMLKPLADALRDNDRIYSLIKATGTNQDGTTAGISHPNTNSQKALLRKVLKSAGVSPHDISYIEAHGTGTQAGDAAEVEALDEVLRAGRDDDSPCLVGSIKSNIGHLEAAAGIAGLIKTALCLHYRSIPGNLHFETPNPKLNLHETCLSVVSSLRDLPSPTSRPVFAGVNSFGYGGTNAHAVLQARDVPDSHAQARAISNNTESVVLFPISARHPDALRSTALNLAESLRTEQRSDNVDLLNNLQYTLTHRRSHHRHRAGFVAQTARELEQQLREFAAQDGDSTADQTTSAAGGLAFVYSGMGPQWWAMGRGLWRTEPVYRDALLECDEHFRRVAGWSIVDHLNASEAESQIQTPEIAQTAGFVVQLGITRLLAEWGITPAAVAGHSVGEVAAAHVSGALTLADAVRVSFIRAHLQQRLSGTGTMLAVGLSADEAESYLLRNSRHITTTCNCRHQRADSATTLASLAATQSPIEIAAINSSDSVTLAGDSHQLEQLENRLTADGIFVRRLLVSIPYHSQVMDRIQDELLVELADINPCRPEKTLYSTVKGARLDDAPDAEYWWSNVRQPVRFADVATAMCEDGVETFLEIGPHPVLSHYLQQQSHTSERNAPAVIPTLRRDEDDRKQLLKAAAQLWTRGHSMQFEAMSPPTGQLIDLPAYPWIKTRFWSESQASLVNRTGTASATPYTRFPMFQPTPTWEVDLNEGFFPWLRDHRVHHSVVLPGAGYVDAAISVAVNQAPGKAQQISDMKFRQLLIIADEEPGLMQLRLNPADGQLKLYSRPGSAEGDWQENCQCRIASFDSQVGNVADWTDDVATIDGQGATALYDKLESVGLQYGPAFRTVKQLKRRHNECLLQLELTSEPEAPPRDYSLHPTILDGAFQAFATLQGDAVALVPFLPDSIDRIVWHSRHEDRVLARVSVQQRSQNTLIGKIELVSPSGQIHAVLDGVTFRATTLAASQSKSQSDLLYQLEWQRDEHWEGAAPQLDGSSWTLVGPHTEAAPLLESLRNSEVSLDNVRSSHDLTPSSHVVYFPPETQHALKSVSGDVVDSVCTQLLDCVRTVASWNQPVRLGIVTRNASCCGQSATESALALSHSPLWGLGRVIRNEYAQIDCRLIDLPEMAKPTDNFLILDSMTANDGETEVAFRNRERWVHRLKRRAESTSDAVDEVSCDDHCVRLRVEASGDLDSICFDACNEIVPNSDQVQIRVHSAPLNYKDLLKVYGQIDPGVTDGTFFGTSLGMECSGTIEAIGDGVTNWRPGDEVIVAAPEGCLGSLITTNSPYIIRKPSTVSFEAAAVTIPYMTAVYGLMDVARLQAGERVLIHNASGGVGIAAIQVALGAGATILATAGTEEKRAYLLGLGLEHVFDSRSLAFVDGVLEATGGKGVDVVLSAQSGPAMTESVKLLAPYGRYVDIGKKDISDNAGLPLGAFNRGLSYCAVDIDRMLLEREDVIHRLLREFYDGFEGGRFHEMPCEVYEAENATNAFHLMGQSRHIGKVVLRFNGTSVRARRQFAIGHDSTWIVTGGTAGFGLEIARWISRQHPSGLVLLSRSGASSQEFERARAELVANVPHLIVESVDVTDQTALQAVLDRARERLPPIRAVVHSAMVLDDQLIDDVSPESFRRVLSPKIDGAVALHHCTLHDPLEHFICFSSISSVVGNAGQAAYVAANSFLDHFAVARRAAGLPGLTVNWGAVADAGVLARHPEVSDVLESLGVQPMPAVQAIDAFRRVLDSNAEPSHPAAQVGIFDVDWQHWSCSTPGQAQPSLYSEVCSDSRSTNSRSWQMLRQAIGRTDVELNTAVVSMATTAVAGVLRIPAADLDATMRLSTLGMDSLAATELSVVLQREFDLTVSSTELLGDFSATSLASRLMSALSTCATEHAAELLAYVEEAPEAEVDRILGLIQSA